MCFCWLIGNIPPSSSISLCMQKMITTALLGLLFERIGDPSSLGNGLDIPATGSLLYHLDCIGKWWSLLLPLVTFVSTFFLSEAYKFFQRCYWTTRGIQGCFNDVSLIVASTAAREENCGEITPEAERAIDDIASILRLLHITFWAAVVRKFNVLTSPEGLSYLLSRGFISAEEHRSLIDAGASCLRAHNVSMLWFTTRIHLAKKRGEIEADHAAMQNIYDKITNLRMLMARIPNMYAGRMPLAYIHFVHFLITTLVLMSPIAMFPMYYYW